MGILKTDGEIYEQARRLENTAHNELDYYERRAMRQRSQLDSLFKYKEECVNGFEIAKQAGLTPLHMREFNLLMKHINSSIETIAYKVDISQEKYERAKEVWQKKSEHFEVIKASVKQKAVIEENPEEVSVDKVKKSGFYDNGAITMLEKSKIRRS